VVTIFSLTALIIVRRRERKNGGKIAIAELDAALNSALDEINKLGALVLADADEKHKAMLFLYSLADEKQKEISEISDGTVVAEKLAKYIETYESKRVAPEAKPQAVPASASPVEQIAALPSIEPAPPVLPMQIEEPPLPPEPKKPPTFTSPKHKKIWEMREDGKVIAEIAKELGLGQGEVKLILNLIDRQ